MSTTPLLEANWELPFDPRLLARDHAKFLREALRAAADFHHRRHIPRHFKHGAASRYGYASRRSRIRKHLTYQDLKRKLGLPPLVSPLETGGATRTAVTTQRQITATQHRATLIMRLPFRGGTGRFRLVPGQRQLTVHQKEVLARIAEIQAITTDEIDALHARVERVYFDQVNAPGTRFRQRSR